MTDQTNQPPLCEDEGCPHHGTPHVCVDLSKARECEPLYTRTSGTNKCLKYVSRTGRQEGDPGDYVFSSGPVPEDSEHVFHVPAGLAETEEAAWAIANFTLIRMGWASDAGIKHGQAEAQRFFRLALGVEAPAERERVYWQNPVPLATHDAMREASAAFERANEVAAAVDGLNTEVGTLSQEVERIETRMDYD